MWFEQPYNPADGDRGSLGNVGHRSALTWPIAQEDSLQHVLISQTKVTHMQDKYATLNSFL